MPVVEANGHTLEAAALILDKDGVLVDFNRIWQGVTRHRVREACALSGRWDCEAMWLELLGLTGDGVKPDGILAAGTRAEARVALAVGLHQSGASWPVARAWAQTALERADATGARHAAHHWLTGAEAVIRHCLALGFKLAIATTDTTAAAMRDLEVVGLHDQGIAVVGADRVNHPKPAPDMVHRACQELAVVAADCVVVGDAVVDLQMGRSAGVKATIGVLSGVGSLDTLAPWADIILDSLAQLDSLQSRRAFSP